MSPPSQKIRALTVDDADAIFEILDGAQAASSDPIGPVWTRAEIEAECAEGLGTVAEIDTRVAAFILYRDLIDAFEITFLATAVDAQRQGLMDRLVKHLLSIKSPNQGLWLEVHAANRPARGLYEKLGFVKVGERASYYRDGGAAILYNYPST